MLGDPVFDDIFTLFFLLNMNLSRLLSVNAPWVKRGVHGLHITGSKFSLRQFVETTLHFFVATGKLHLVGGPAVVLVKFLFLLLLSFQ
jgi:hypothetical protein